MEQVQQLEAAIAAQEALRPLLGDVVVDVAISALRAQLMQLQTAAQETTSEGRWLAQLQSYLPPELAAKIRALGRIEGERRQVTVLFADVSGFTALSERLDPEEVTAIMNDVLQELAKAVYSYEGYIDKFIGDAVMAVFGAPIAHEDDPERALRAALAMRERMDAINRRWEARLPEPLTLHIGINTGLVIAGAVGSDARLSYTMMGDSVNIAARLEDAAQPNQILVSRTTYRLTQTAFTFAALPPMVVKGKQEPIVVYELMAARRAPDKRRGLRDLRDAFLGRDSDLDVLLRRIGELETGRGHIVVVSGEAGMGKSRLLAESRQQAKPGVAWLEGRAFQHTKELPYGPFLDLLRRVMGISDDDSEAQARARFEATMAGWPLADSAQTALLALLLGLSLRAEERAFVDSLADEGIRRRVRDAISALLSHLADNRPMVLVLEDMHWADTSSLELVEYLLPKASALSMLIVIVVRSYTGDISAKIQAYLEELPADQRSHLPLRPLSADESAAMVRQLLDQPDLPPKLHGLLHSKAEGNPFFVEEVLRMLIDRGALMRDPAAGWVATNILDEVTVPDTLQGVLMARLDRLYPETKWVLQQAAVIGRIFLYRVLLHLEAARDLDADLSLLEREELIRERTRSPEIEYIFKHALTQEVAYQSLLTSRRKELHRRTAETIEQLFTDRLSEFYPILAQHFREGEAWEKAADYLIRSGDLAARLYAHEEARSHYGSALEALRKLPDTAQWRRLRIDVAIRMAKVALVAENPQINLDRLAEAEACAQALMESGEEQPEDQLRMARIHYWMGTFHVLHVGGLPVAMPYFAKVLPIAQETGDEELLLVPSMIIGRGMVVRGQFSKAIPLFERILPMLERVEDWGEWVLTTVFLGLAQAAGGEYSRGLATIADAQAKAQELNNSTGQVYGHMFMAAASVHGADAELMLGASQRGFQAASISGDRLYEYFGAGFQAWAWMLKGDQAQAEEWLARCQDLGQSLGGHLVLSDWFAALGAEIALGAGQIPVALERAQACADSASELGGLFAAGLAERVLARALLAASPPDAAQAAEHLEASVRAYASGGAKLEAARSQALLAALRAQAGDHTEAVRLAVSAHAALAQAGLTAEAAQLEGLVAPAIAGGSEAS